MTTEVLVGRAPSFTIGDRLRKARTTMPEPMDVRPFAALLGISSNTVTNYELENTPADRMKPVILKAWAMATGVSFEWLINGETPSPSGDGVSARAPRDSNPRPSDLWPVASLIERIAA